MVLIEKKVKRFCREFSEDGIKGESDDDKKQRKAFEWLQEELRGF